jgi:hypothetical protein
MGCFAWWSVGVFVNKSVPALPPFKDTKVSRGCQVAQGIKFGGYLCRFPYHYVGLWGVA